MTNSLLEELMNPKRYEYELSEKLFLDVWKEHGKPTEIIDNEEIFKFLNDIIIRSNGWVIFDQFDLGNYDNIKEIKMKDKYTMIVWKDYNKYRLKYLNGILTEDEEFNWYISGYGTYLYSFLYINKIKFVNIKSHLFVLLMSNYINRKDLDKVLLNNNEKICVDENISDLNIQYVFFEGNKKNLIKHICKVNSLPFYSCLIQPKEGSYSCGTSRDILLDATLDEINIRMEKAYTSLMDLENNDYDEIFSKGNTIRRILEYSLKYLLIYFDAKMEVSQKYGHLELGKLNKQIKNNDINIQIPQNIINTANELSHDSGKIYQKLDVITFYKDVMKLINSMFDSILNKNFKY